MTKLGRPRKHSKPVERMSISFSPEAWDILNLVQPGKRSELISYCVSAYAMSFPQFFAPPKKGKSRGHNRRSS